MTIAAPTLGNTARSYGSVAKTFHWLTALLIVTAIPLGMIAHDWPYDTSEALAVKAVLFSLHKTIGVSTFFVALLRILWALAQPKPGLLHPDRRVEALAAETVHWLLYASLVAVPLSGWLHHAASSGFAPIWWPLGQTLPFVPVDDGVSAFFSGWHSVLTKVLVAALVLHIAGAVKHAVIDKDATLARMLPGVTAPEVPDQTHDRRPLGIAAGIYLLALAVGTVIGLMGPEDGDAAVTPQLTQAPTGWEVQDGTLGITVMQLGAPVEGSFATWTAAIEFDPEAAGPEAGTVAVDIAIGSLTLGSVTGEALKPEFFDADAHPTARFAATIQTTESPGAYTAKGTLTLKGTEVPVTLPFTLQLDGDVASMEGSMTLDRRDFGIGTSQYGDEATVQFGVDVGVALTATRTPDA